MTGRRQDEPCSHAGLDRRGFLGLAGATLATTGLASLLGAAPAEAEVPSRRPGAGPRFGLISDTHVNTTSPASTTYLGAANASLARRDPDFVLHCGDITDSGLADEYVQYGRTIPDSLRGRIHYSPGNHEMRWDASAKELYHAHFGPAPYSFDSGGVHFIGFDPTQVLQEPGHYGQGNLDWLERDLRRLRPGTPAVLFQHYPMGNTFYFVDDQPAALDLLARYGVRGLFVGHIHREDIARFNGLTQVGLKAVLNGPVYYWAQPAGDGSPVLEVTRVTVRADGTDLEEPYATMPLAGTGPGVPQRPTDVRLGKVSGGALPVAVATRPDATPVSVSVQPYPQTIFGGTRTPVWQPLASAGPNRWSASVDVSALAPGEQRLEVQVLAEDGSWWRDIASYAVPGTASDPVERWSHQLPGSVQGGITPIARGTVAAASTAGDLVTIDGRRQRWQTRLGPVYRRPAVDAAGRTLFVPSADHHLYAVDAATGRQRWRFDAGAPVLSTPDVRTVGGREQVVFSAGQGLFALTAATGRPLWTVPDRGFSSGQPAGDGQMVYTAAADGYARAHDAATGEPVWANQMVSGVPHRVLLYSGWDCVVAVGGGVVIVATVSQSTALDAATGAVRWTVSGSTMYAPAVLVEGAALLTTEWGVLTKVDLQTGKTLWQTDLAVRVFNAGVVVADRTAWVASVDGKLIGVRLADGVRLGWLQHSLVYTFGRPVIADGTLVVGDQNGVVHGIALPY
ncbi:outer membrane protein assembly factor BamB family protein [Amycolatopsis alkalitolerans]|uniref:Uncharacterized protein n=1 Tax=Amycolatopsis alkalitolerans TaxID=2547244 RepID=A0A5C4LU49_9PSEU|nr:PQQ-binding-like beta-propeller repeat protein [Amycolatopsis alkalitolerans]TNC21011.1 hypothetical protein FG385_29640 [Amycolatopsis alkalitolerans]